MPGVFVAMVLAVHVDERELGALGEVMVDRPAAIFGREFFGDCAGKLASARAGDFFSRAGLILQRASRVPLVDVVCLAHHTMINSEGYADAISTRNGARPDAAGGLVEGEGGHSGAVELVDADEEAGLGDFDGLGSVLELQF